MTNSSSTDALIEDLLEATYGCNATMRQKYAFRETLFGLVRLAKAEQLHEMRTTVEKLINGPLLIGSRQKTKSRQRNQLKSGRCPQQMEFNQFE